ncbi:MAG: hypothetical protein HC828_13295 [Blastochloris sp.]|nr:hypothetical protein [Blastochloris sp.]
MLDRLLRMSGRTVDAIHIVGGGSQNALLCQMTADATGRIVIAGPTEATALGNAIAQFIALGELSSIADARQMLSRTVETRTYEPKNVTAWNDVYELRYRQILTTL